MRKGLLLAIVLMVSGCDKEPKPEPPPPPKPSIRVERQEDVKGVKLVIWYDNHHQESLGNHRYLPYVSFQIGDEADLREYKKQLEFALSQIEEIEQRMIVHEPEAKKGESSNEPHGP